MSAVFDPYQAWLGIPRHEQPPHHYRLLGIAPLEADPAVIQSAAERQTKTLQMQAVGPYIALAQQICGEVAAARYCLLTPATKSAYDAQLGPRLTKAAASPAPARPMPAAEPLLAAPPLPAATVSAPPRPAPPRPQPIPQAMPAAVPPMAPSADARPSAKPPSRPSVPRPRPSSPSQGNAGRSAFEMAKIIVGGIAGLAIAVLLLNYFVGIDPLGWSVSSRKEDAKPKKVAEARPRIVTQPMVPSNPSLSPQPREPAFPGSIGQVGPNNFPPSNQPNRGPPTRNGSNPPPPVNRPPSAPPEEILATDEPRSLADLTKPSTGSGVPSKKSALPSASEQATKLAQIKDIYKTEFAAAKPGANTELVSFLRTTAAKVEGDPVARYVLYSEAFKQACAGNDFEAAAETLDNLEAEFESEPFAPRFELLTSQGSSAKANDERLIAARSALLLFDHALALGKFEEADKLARIADTQTKIIIDKDLRAKAVAALQTTSELVKDLKSVTDAREKLAQTPDDAAANQAVGRYVCLIEGNWAAGLPHLAKCEDEALRRVATLDMAGPSGETTAGKIGDAWYDLAKGGKGQNFYARADYWYQKGMEGESGLSLARLKKRREEIGEFKLPPRLSGQVQQQLAWPTARELVSGGGDLPSTDLLTLVNQQTIKPPQGWTKNGGSWRSPAASQDAYAFFECSFQPPRRDYTMTARVTRSIGRDTKGREAGFVTFGLTQRGKRFAVVIDEVSSSGQRRAYLTMGSAGESQNTSVVIYPQVKLRSDDIVCNVTKDKITVWVSGSQLLQYTGDMSVLALPSDAKYPPSKAFFYAQQCGVNVIDHWSVGPLVEQPTPAPEAPPSRPRTSPKFTKPGPGNR